VANEAIMGIVGTFEDEASAGLRNLGRNVQAISREFRQSVNAIGRFGQAMTNILVLANLLPGSLGQAVNKTLLLATTTVNAVYAVTQLVAIYDKLNKTHRASIALQSILAALTGVGIGKVALGVAAGGALAVGALALADRASSGVTANVPARSSGGGTPSITVVNNGVMMGNEADARRLARQIQGFNREDERLGR